MLDHRRRRKWGRLAGLGAGLGAVVLLNLPGAEQLHAPGPMNTGHGELACEDCHVPAPGSLRQQFQAQVRFLLGMRAEPAIIGFLPVGNEDCLDCHRRARDRHPVFRFFEPRYTEARRILRPQHCTSCHQEHQGRRVTRSPDFCRICHGKLTLKRDPLDIPHARLVRDKRWRSCLRCHDFHGNHRMRVAQRLSDAIPEERISRYFAGAASPYSRDKYDSARKTRSRRHE